MPFGSVVAVKNNSQHAKIDGRGLVGVCLGPDPRFGRGAISVLIGGQERQTRTFKFIEAPGTEVEPVPDLIAPATGERTGRESMAAALSVDEELDRMFIRRQHRRELP